MEKVIHLGKTPVRLKSNGLVLLLYKREFGRDFIPDLYSICGEQKDLEDVRKKGFELDKVNLEIMYNVTYIFAKIADPNIGTRDEWLCNLDTFPVVDVITEILPFIEESITTDATLKNQLATAGLKRMTKSSKQRKSFFRHSKRG